MRIELAYGRQFLGLEMPRGVPFDLIEINDPKVFKDPAKTIAEALRNPVASLPLKQVVRPNERICILVNDTTRLARSEVFLPVLIDELKLGGIEHGDICIVFANGSHRPLSKGEMVALVGEDIASRVRMYNHDSKNNRELVFLGYTSRETPVWINERVVQADRRILTGSVVHHYFAGFGGGRKALVPGVAGWETIRVNHSLMLDDSATTGILNGNPVHEDLLEAALLVGGDFLLNTVLNDNKEIVGVFAGDMIQAHLQACEMADRIYGVKIERLADVVIAGCGGYPKDINLYQAHKALDNATRAMKPGGSLVLLAECGEGIGSSLYEKWVDKYKNMEELEEELRRNFNLGGHKAFTVSKLLQKGQVYLVSSLDPETARRFGFIPAASLEGALAEVYRDKSKAYTCVLPQGSLAVPLTS